MSKYKLSKDCFCDDCWESKYYLKGGNSDSPAATTTIDATVAIHQWQDYEPTMISDLVMLGGEDSDSDSDSDSESYDYYIVPTRKYHPSCVINDDKYLKYMTHLEDNMPEYSDMSKPFPKIWYNDKYYRLYDNKRDSKGKNIVEVVLQFEHDLSLMPEFKEFKNFIANLLTLINDKTNKDRADNIRMGIELCKNIFIERLRRAYVAVSYDIFNSDIKSFINRTMVYVKFNITFYIVKMGLSSKLKNNIISELEFILFILFDKVTIYRFIMGPKSKLISKLEGQPEQMKQYIDTLQVYENWESDPYYRDYKDKSDKSVFNLNLKDAMDNFYDEFEYPRQDWLDRLFVATGDKTSKYRKMLEKKEKYALENLRRMYITIQFDDYKYNVDNIIDFVDGILFNRTTTVREYLKHKPLKSSINIRFMNESNKLDWDSIAIFKVMLHSIN